MAKKEILLAKNFPLPVAAITESIAIMGRKGRGKTYTGGRLFEQMHGVGAQCVALDPVGNWWGLRVSASGKRRGLDIPVFGGDHGDIPITPESGKLMAEVVVQRRISCVIDLMLFKKAQRKRFVTDFAEELFHLKKKHRSPLHMYLEEARKFIPQKLFGPDDARMVGAFEDIVRLGRNYGLGSTLLDQRPQSVNKEVLSQVEIFIVHQLTEKHGRKEIEAWVRAKDVEGADQLKEVAKLDPGEAFVWSPGLLRKFAKVKVGKKSTYDASATPELGAEEDEVETRPLSDKDLAKLQKSMADVVEQVAAKDPKKLRQQLKHAQAQLNVHAKTIAGLEAELDSRPAEVERVEVPVIDPGRIITIDNAVGQLESVLRPIGDDMADLRRTVEEIKVAACKAAQSKTSQNQPKYVKSQMRSPKRAKSNGAPARAGRPPGVPAGGSDLTGPEQRILNAVAWMESIGVDKPEVVAVAFLAGYKAGGGSFNNARGSLRSGGFVEYCSGKRITMTDTGRSIAAHPEQPLTTESLQEAVMLKLAGPERRILAPLIKEYPGSLSVEDLAIKAGYQPGGGSFNNARGRLRTLGLAVYPERGMVCASDVLFLGEE